MLFLMKEGKATTLHKKKKKKKKQRYSLCDTQGIQGECEDLGALRWVIFKKRHVIFAQDLHQWKVPFLSCLIRDIETSAAKKN